MRTVLLFQWGTADRPQEDSFLRDDEHGIFLVADGVTRTAPDTGYPNPSPAKLASDCLLQTTHRSLLSFPRDLESLGSACRAGNDTVRQLNHELGLWDNHDYWERDLAGAVFSGLLVGDTSFVWGFMTDCGVAHLTPEGEILWATEDRLTPVRKYFPSLPQAKERQIAIRRDFRNSPAGDLQRTYGVFTGEEGALRYLEVGRRSYTEGDVLLVFTDGITHLVKDSAFRSLLCKGSSADIEHFVSLPEHCQHPDDKTILVVHV